jgi:hypothetical protein
MTARKKKSTRRTSTTGKKRATAAKKKAGAARKRSTKAPKGGVELVYSDVRREALARHLVRLR